MAQISEGPQRISVDTDPSIRRLAALFLGHPAWIAAARHIASSAQSDVYFSHRPGEVWHLEQRKGRTRLLAGASRDPDFAFRFTPDAIAQLEAVEGGVGDFALALFELMVAEDPEFRVDIRVVAGFARLTQRGYLRLLVSVGPRALAFGAAHGVRTLGALRRFVSTRRTSGPAEWEIDGITGSRHPKTSSYDDS